jgi:hypothetical protein
MKASVSVFIVLRSFVSFAQEHSDVVITVQYSFVDSISSIVWSTNTDTLSSKFIIEQYRWNKWVKIGEQSAINKTGNKFSFIVTPHAGNNKIRVVYDTIISNEVEFSVNTSYQPLVPRVVGEAIILKTASNYEIYNQFGDVILSGTATIIDTSKLPKGVYYIAINNEMREFIKK